MLSVKLSVEEAPFTIGVEKDLLMVGGGTGELQPVTTMSSRFMLAPVGFAPSALILKIVVLVPVLAAANV